jgi:hypothetical protein
MTEWILTYWIGKITPQRDIQYISKLPKDVIFLAETEKDALQIALQKLKTAIRRTRGTEPLIVIDMLNPKTVLKPKQMHLDHSASQLYRIKERYSNRRLLRIKNPSACFVKGYGPKALVQLGVHPPELYNWKQAPN